VDIACIKAFFAAYYDARQFTSLNSGFISGSSLNILITTSVTPDVSQVEQTIGGPSLNSGSSPVGMAVKFVGSGRINNGSPPAGAGTCAFCRGRCRHLGDRKKRAAWRARPRVPAASGRWHLRPGK